MRILQVGPVPPEVGGLTTGGVATHVWQLSCHLAKRGHEVAILADNFHNPPELPITKDGVKIYGFSRPFILKHSSSILLNLSTLIKLKKHFEGLHGTRGIIPNLCYYDYVNRHFRPDIIHVHHLERRFPYVHFIVKDRIPIITTVHSFHSIKFLGRELRGKYRRLIAKNLKLAKNLILVSKLVEKELNEFFGECQSTRWIVLNPIDIERYYPLPEQDACRERIGLPKQIPVLLFVGGLVRRKGIYVLLETAKLLREKGTDFRVIMVGDGPEREGIEKFIIEKGMEDVVQLEGAKSYPELLYYYNSADLFVMPTFSEGFSLVYLEAMLCGIPVIGTKGVTAESIPSEDYGLLVPAGNAYVLAETIEKGVDKKWDREKIIKYACSFSWDKRIVEFEKVYEQIITDSTRWVEGGL